MSTIRFGDMGPFVLEWQRIVGVDATGTFDAATLEATKRYQLERGLVADGVVGPATWATTDVGDGELVPTKRTPIQIHEYADAVRTAWPTVESTDVDERSIALLWSQYWCETGGKACWNYNIGNVKKVTGDRFNWIGLAGVWECVHPAEAARIVTSGRGAYAPQHSHACPKGTVAVVFNPNEPEARFRAFATLADAMFEHLKFLRRRFGNAWPAVLIGDVNQFARELKVRGYFTASAQSYAANMQSAYNLAIRLLVP